MPRYLSILAVQAAVRPYNADAALQGFEQEIADHLCDFRPAGDKARHDTPCLVIYPELHLCGVTGTPAQRAARLADAAEPIDGPRMQRLAAIARTHGIWLIPGTLCERGEDGHLYNTAPVFSPTGERVAAYRKCFPWRPFEPYRPGNELSVFDIPGVGRLGLAICYDIWFPEVCRQLAWSGAELIINPVATSTADRAQEQVLIRANAIFNQVFMVSINAAAPTGVGRSATIDPEGHVRASLAETGPHVLTDVLNLDEVERVRTFGTVGINRLWSQYRADDPILELPMYEGRLDPKKWLGNP